MPPRQTDRSLTAIYLGVVLVEVGLVIALWLLSQAY